MFVAPEDRPPLPPRPSRNRRENEIEALQREVLGLVAAWLNALRGLALDDATAEVHALRRQVETLNRLRETGL